MFGNILLTLILGVGVAVDALADSDNSIKVAAPWEISSTDPATDGYVFLRMGVMETLVSTDENGALTPGLATQWVASDNSKTWTFELRDAKFHDASVLTAEVAVIALNTCC